METRRPATGVGWSGSDRTRPDDRSRAWIGAPTRPATDSARRRRRGWGRVVRPAPFRRWTEAPGHRRWRARAPRRVATSRGTRAWRSGEMLPPDRPARPSGKAPGHDPLDSEGDDGIAAGGQAQRQVLRI